MRERVHGNQKWRCTSVVIMLHLGYYCISPVPHLSEQRHTVRALSGCGVDSASDASMNMRLLSERHSASAAAHLV